MDYFTIGREFYSGYMLPLICAEEAELKSVAALPDIFQLLFVDKGGGSVVTGARQTRFAAPAIVCLGDTDSVRFQAADPLSAKRVFFRPNVINESYNCSNIRQPQPGFSLTEEQDLYLLTAFLQPMEERRPCISVPAHLAAQLTSIIHSMQWELEIQRDTHWPCRSRSLLLEMLILVARLSDMSNQQENSQSGATIVQVGEMISYLQSNVGEKIAIHDVATAFRVNRTTLNRQFREATGLSVIDYLIRYRVHLASTLLRDTLLPVSEIMQRTGFSDYTHFWRMFRKHTGVAPSQYRSKYGWMKEG